MGYDELENAEDWIVESTTAFLLVRLLLVIFSENLSFIIE